MRSLALVLTFAAINAAGGSPAAEWKQITSNEGNYSVMLPGMPDDVVQPAAENSDAGPQHLKLLPVDSGSCMVMYVDYAPAVLRTMKPEALLAATRDALVGDGEVRLDRKVACGEYPGIELAVLRDGPSAPCYWRARIYLVDHRLYQIVIVGNGKPVPNDDVLRIFKSFSLLKPAEAAPAPIAATRPSAVPVSAKPARGT